MRLLWRNELVRNEHRIQAAPVDAAPMDAPSVDAATADAATVDAATHGRAHANGAAGDDVEGDGAAVVGSVMGEQETSRLHGGAAGSKLHLEEDALRRAELVTILEKDFAQHRTDVLVRGTQLGRERRYRGAIELGWRCVGLRADASVAKKRRDAQMPLLRGVRANGHRRDDWDGTARGRARRGPVEGGVRVLGLGQKRRGD